MSRAQIAFQLLSQGNAAAALAMAREAVAIDPAEVLSETARGDSAAALGLKEEARAAWKAALTSAKQLEPDAQVSYAPDLEAKLKKL
jgi:Tfp pilus assembly protein PilF